MNSNDVVPFAWAGLMNIVNNNVPTYVPPLLSAAIQTIHIYMQDSGIVYKHVETRQDLGTVNPTYCPNDSSYSNYECWISFEHSSNTYLRLLNTDTINWSRFRSEIILFK